MAPQQIPEEPEEFEPDSDGEAEDWDEETLGLDWNEADAQTLVDEVVPQHRFGG